MANQEIVKILRVETNNSERTVKTLKQEITLLRDALLNVEKGGEDYNAILTQLRQNQSDLTEAMTAGKQGVEALEGSYNYLQETLKNLKKEWKSTTDEIRRNELGKEIDNINNQLKEMDSTIGNYQRNVGNYANDITKALDKQNTASENTVKKLASVQKMASGLASGYAAVQGATALLGVENEDLQKTFVKLQGAIALAQGVGGLKDFIEGISDAKKAFKGASEGVKIFNISLKSMKGALISTGIGALVVLIGVLIAKFAEWRKESNKVQDSASALIEAQNKAREAFKNFAIIDKNIDIMTKYNKKVLEAKGNLNLLTKAQKEYNEELAKGNLQTLQSDLNNITKYKKDLTAERNRMFPDANARALLSMSDETFALAKNNAVGDVERRQWRQREKYRKNNKELFDNIQKQIEEYEKEEQVLTEKIIQIQTGIANAIVDITVNANNQILDNTQKIIESSNNAINKTITTIDGAKTELEKGAVSVNEEMKKINEDEIAEINKITQANNEYLKNTELTTKERLRLEQEGARLIEAVKMRYERKRINQNQSEELARLEKEYNEKLQAFKKSEETITTLQKNYEKERNIINQKSAEERIKIIAERDKQIAQAQTEEQKKAINESYNKMLEAEQQSQAILLSEKETYYKELIAKVTVNEDELTQLTQWMENKRVEIYKKGEAERNELYKNSASNYLDGIRAELDMIDSNAETSLNGYVKSNTPNGNETPLQQLQADIALIEEIMRVEKEAYNQKAEYLNAELEQEYLTRDEKIAILQELANAEDDFTRNYERLSQERTEATQKESIARKEQTKQILTSSLNVASQVSNALVAISEAEMNKYEEGTEEHKKAWEINKKLSIGQAIINTAESAIGAYLSMAKIPVVGPVLGGIAAAAATALGMAQIQTIRNTTYDGGGANNVNTSVGTVTTPSFNTAEALPIEYTRNLQTDSETAELNKPTRVYVLESDITDAQNKVRVTENNATF